MQIDTSGLEDDSYKQPSVEELQVGQVLWFMEWLETADRDVQENYIHAPIIWCGTIKEIEQTSFQKGFMYHGRLQPDIKTYTIHFEEGGKGAYFYVGEKEYLNPQFWLDKDVLIAQINEDKEENIREAEERLAQAERDLDRYKAWRDADIPLVDAAAAAKGFRWTTVMSKQSEVEAA
jgi:hypothetical protein